MNTLSMKNLDSMSAKSNVINIMVYALKSSEYTYVFFLW